MNKNIGIMMEQLGVVPGDENKALPLPGVPMYADENPCEAHNWSAKRTGSDLNYYVPHCTVCGIRGAAIYDKKSLR
jgi:hypothetical protein